MKDNKLISMTDFVLGVLNRDFPYNEVKMLTEISNYATFLKQPLKLEMFVPCDDEGNVLDDKGECSCAGNTEWCHGCNSWHYHNDIFTESDAYLKAKEKVLFEGFYWEGNYAVCMAEDEMIYIDDEFMWNMTIDKFLTTIITDLQLTHTAIKQIQP